jgi:hypothetical protein
MRRRRASPDQNARRKFTATRRRLSPRGRRRSASWRRGSRRRAPYHGRSSRSHSARRQCARRSLAPSPNADGRSCREPEEDAQGTKCTRGGLSPPSGSGFLALGAEVLRATADGIDKEAERREARPARRQGRQVLPEVHEIAARRRLAFIRH